MIPESLQYGAVRCYFPPLIFGPYKRITKVSIYPLSCQNSPVITMIIAIQVSIFSRCNVLLATGDGGTM